MNTDNIDSEGYRANVGIIISNNEGKLFLAGRIGSNSWQFPQGGFWNRNHLHKQCIENYMKK